MRNGRRNGRSPASDLPAQPHSDQSRDRERHAGQLLSPPTATACPSVTTGLAITLLEGGTPLIPATRLSEYTGCTVHLKVEGLNPTGSFKSRGMTMAVTDALARGQQPCCVGRRATRPPRRPPMRHAPASTPHPAPSTAGAQARCHSPGTDADTSRTATGPRTSAAPRPPHTPRPRRTRPLPRPSFRHQESGPISWCCARRYPYP